MNNIPHFNDFVTAFAEDLIKKSISNGNFNLISEKEMIFKINELAKRAYGLYLEKLDNDFFKSEKRKCNYKIKQIRPRVIDTIFGSVTFKRRQYIDKRNNQYFYYIDSETLNIKKYQRLSNELIANIIKDVTEFSYPQVARMNNISKTTVYNKIRSLRDYILDTIEYPDVPKEIDILYLQADECYVPNQNKKEGRSTMIHTITIHEGLTKECKNRNALVNKKILTKSNIETNIQFYSRIHDTITKLYDYKKLYFYGDGALWIKNCAETIGGIYILDLFHAGQAITRLCSIKNKDHIGELIKKLVENNKNGFIQYVKENLDYQKLITNDFRYRNYKYVLNNWKSIQRNYSLNKSVGCSQEGINFHCFARYLTTLPKGYSSENARVIAQLLCCKNNNSDFEKLILNTIIEVNKSNDNSYKKNTKYTSKQGHIESLYKSKNIRDIINATILA
jgi:hypothetical protein